MTSVPRLTLLTGGGQSHKSPLNLANFPLGSRGGSAVSAFRSKSGRLHLNLSCASLSRSRSPRGEKIQVATGESLADLAGLDAHCLPNDELASYLSTALRLCDLAGRLPSLAQRLGTTLSSLESEPARSVSYGYYEDVDLQVAAAAYDARAAFREATGAVPPVLPLNVSAEQKQLLKAAVTPVLRTSERLYEHALAAARSESGREALARMLAARCILTGRLPRQYAPLYQRFRATVGEALSRLAAASRDVTDSMVYGIESHGLFDLPRRWLEEIANDGRPDRAASALRDQMTQWAALNGPELDDARERILELANQVGLAFLNGLWGGCDSSSLVLVAAHETPFGWDAAAYNVQWDVYPSAVCRLRGERPSDASQEARVSIVPHLWIRAAADPAEPYKGGEFVVLLHDLQPLAHPWVVCSTVATAIQRSCHAGLLDCRRWFPTVPRRMAYEGRAREIAARAVEPFWSGWR